MPSTPNQNGPLQLADERLGDVFYINGRYNATFLAVTGIGFGIIYLLTRFHILGEPTPQLLYISGAIFFTALLQIPVINLARRKKGIAANFLGSLSVIIFAVLLTAFWEGTVLIAILLTFVTPLAAIISGIPRKYIPQLSLMIIAGISGILYINANPPIIRMQTATTVAIASLAFLTTTGLLLITVVIARSRSWRSLRAQLLVSFIIIVTIPTLLATILSTIGAYVNNEAQVINVLQTVAKLKENQINGVVGKFKVDALEINADPEFSRSALNLLIPGRSDQVTLELYRSFARGRLLNYLNTDKNSYSEFMILNLEGSVVISTDLNADGRSFESELFYRNARDGDFAGFSKNPIFGDSNLIFSTPIYDTDGQTLRGILVLRSHANLIIDIVESTPSFNEMETYLLDNNFLPLTKTRSVAQTFRTQESESILSNKIDNGSGTYKNYAGEIVLGFYERLDSLNAVFIAEVPRTYILRVSINSLLGSASLAIFAIAIAIAAVAISAESIADPISALAKIAESFAAGKFSTRASFNRRDEIGALGKAYDQMAEQLQEIIGKLEQRVADRTKELEEQTSQLRASAEIARDAASSHNLNELLEKAGTLIQERFKVYHTGIFLLDTNSEFVVLTASPTEAGKQMIADNYKIRVGEAGIVGRVAFTEDARITLDTGIDAVLFNHPYLPNTRSEMALPLKVEDRMIGVLDVQSDQAQAFSEDNIAIMQILADQLATAIERTRLLQQVEQNLNDLEHAYGQFTREGWKTLGESGLLSKSGYRFDNIRIQPITDVPELGDETLRTGRRVTRRTKSNNSNKNLVALPIKLRGQTIGVVSANLKDGYTQNTISTLELAIERLALSLESARLYEEARLRADREQTIAQVTSNITSATEFDAILRTTIEEIGKSISDTEVSIQIVNTAD